METFPQNRQDGGRAFDRNLRHSKRKIPYEGK